MSPIELGTVLLSALLHASWSVSIKGSRSPVAFNALQIFPQAVVGLALLPLVDLGEVPRATWLGLAGAGVAHALYLLWMSRAYELADLSLVYPIARSAPAFLPLFAVPLLGETISPLGALGIATVVAGMWAVQAGAGLRLSAFVQRGTGFAYLTLLSTIAYSLVDKISMSALDRVSWTSPVPRALFYYFAIEIACGVIYVPLSLARVGSSGMRETWAGEWRSVLWASCLTTASYALILHALRTAPASYVVAARQVSVLFVLILSVWLLGEKPTRVRVIGAFATVAGVVMLGFTR